MKTEEEIQFLKFVKDERVKFSMDFGEPFFKLKPKYRVIIENLLIAYDQLVERVENNQP